MIVRINDLARPSPVRCADVAYHLIQFIQDNRNPLIQFFFDDTLGALILRVEVNNNVFTFTDVEHEDNQESLYEIVNSIHKFYHIEVNDNVINYERYRKDCITKYGHWVAP